MFEQWLRATFEVKNKITEDGQVEVVVVTNEPVRETVLTTLVDIFNVTAINYDNLIACVGDTGLDVIIDDWKSRGLLD